MSKIVEWCVKKVLMGEEQRIKEKIAEHQSKAEHWKKILKEYIEVEEANKKDDILPNKSD